MATAPDPSIDELNRQAARIEAEARKLRAEADKLSAEQLKLTAEERKLAAEERKLLVEGNVLPRNMIFQAMIATAALLGAGAAIAKIFFP